MKNVADRSLVIGALLVGLILTAAMWFFAISPKLSSAQVSRDATMAQTGVNDGLVRTLDQRKKDAAEVPNFVREIYAIRDLLPPTEDIMSIRRTMDQIADSIGVVIDSDTVGEPEPIYGGLSLAPQMEAVGLTSLIEGMTFTNLLSTSYSFEVVGTPAQIIAVVDEVEKGDHRYFFITDISISEADVSGTLKASITFWFFTLDYGNPDITVRPPERPWPGDEGEEAPETQESPASPFEPAPEG